MISSDEGLEARFTMEGERGGVIDEPPFRLLVLADLSGDGAKKDVSARRPIEIDRDNFDEILSRIAPNLLLSAGVDSAAPLELTFRELDDFHPDNIFANVPMFAELRDLRRRLKKEDSFYEAAREVRSWFPPPKENHDESAPEASSEPSQEGAPDDLLSHILSQPSGGSGSMRPKAAASSELNSLIGELVRPHLVRVDENEQAEMLKAVDEATSGLMRAILHDHRFQSLEAAWRGLYFLVRRAETGEDLKLFVLNISKDELAGDLRSVNDLTGTHAYKLLVAETVEVPGGEPWAAVFGDYGFLPTIDDTAALVRLSKIAAVAGAPFVSHMRPDVLGIHSLEGNTDPRTWTLSGDTEAAKLWSAIRSLGEAEYLGMTIPRFLARLPYGAETEPLESFSFEEFSNTPEHDKYLWANAAYACAALLAQSFSAFGWQMDKRFIQDLERIPVHVYESNGETVYLPCAEVQLTHDGCDRLMEFGLMPLVSFKNTDHVRLARFQSVAEPVTGLRGRWRS